MLQNQPIRILLVGLKTDLQTKRITLHLDDSSVKPPNYPDKKYNIQAHVCLLARSVESQSCLAHSFPIKNPRMHFCWQSMACRLGRNKTNTHDGTHRRRATSDSTVLKTETVSQSTQYKRSALSWFYFLKSRTLRLLFCSIDSSWGRFRGFLWFRAFWIIQQITVVFNRASGLTWEVLFVYKDVSDVKLCRKTKKQAENDEWLQPRRIRFRFTSGKQTLWTFIVLTLLQRHKH